MTVMMMMVVMMMVMDDDDDDHDGDGDDDDDDDDDGDDDDDDNGDGDDDDDDDDDGVEKPQNRSFSHVDLNSHPSDQTGAKYRSTFKRHTFWASTQYSSGRFE